MADYQTHIYSGATHEEVARDLADLVDFQESGVSSGELQKMLDTKLLPHLMNYDSPRFQSMFNTFPNDKAWLGAKIMLEYNQGVTNWQVSPGGATLEELCVQALCRLFKLGPNADATFMYSGTYGNQLALYLALHRHAEKNGFNLALKGICGFTNPQKLAILAAENAHFSLIHAVRMLGLGEESLIPIPVDANFRVDITNLASTLQALQGERDIVCIVGTAGTTATGAIDPIMPLAELCAEIDAWLHIDGAYGYAYKLVPQWADRFAGDHLADSITWDPHKQIGAPIPNSLLFVKNGQDFQRAALYASYFNQPGLREPNPGLKSPPSTRPMSVLPLVTIIRGMGLNRLIEGLRAPLTAVRDLAIYLESQSDIELCHQPETGILCFRMHPAGLDTQELDNLQYSIYQRIMAAGQRSISTTKLAGKQVLRLVVVSPDTTFTDLQETIDELRSYL